MRVPVKAAGGGTPWNTAPWFMSLSFRGLVMVASGDSEYVPMCVWPQEWEHSAFIKNLGGESYRLLFWSDTDIGFEHRCDRGDRGVIICAPRLTQHQLTGPRDKPTVTPSILCSDCGTHGFITDGRWVDA